MINVSDFKDFCIANNVVFDSFTTEKTFQLWLSIYIWQKSQEKKLSLDQIFLEFNTKESGERFIKKELDILLLMKKQKIGFELKLHKDRATDNISMIEFIKDLKFLEELVNGEIITSGYQIFFTNLESLYKSSKRRARYNNALLYEDFLINQKLIGGKKYELQAGKKFGPITLRNSYELNWKNYDNTYRYINVEVI